MHGQVQALYYILAHCIAILSSQPADILYWAEGLHFSTFTYSPCVALIHKLNNSAVQHIRIGIYIY